MPETDPTRIYIPVRKAFENGNSFTGSRGLLRFLLEPTEDRQIRARIWHGEYCFEKSEVEEERCFPLSDDGRAQLRDWLESLNH